MVKKNKRAFWGKVGKMIVTAALLGVCMLSSKAEVNAEYKRVPESELPLSTMHVYRNMDTSFLKTFPYGTTYEGEVYVELQTGAEMIEATDVRLKEGRIV